MLRDAVAIQDKLNYGRAAGLVLSRFAKILGGALLMSGDAAGAEKVFREDLDRNPRNPRSLCGAAPVLGGAETRIRCRLRAETI